MPQIFHWHPLCVALMPLKKIHGFWGQWSLCPWAKYNIYNSLLPECCTSHSQDRYINCARPYQFRGAYWRYWEKSTFYFSSANKMTKPNEQQCQYTLPHSTKVDLFCANKYNSNIYSKYSLGQLWDVVDPKLIQPLASVHIFYAMRLTQQIRMFSLKWW